MLCKEQVAQLCDRVQEIRAAGADLVVIGSGSPEQAGWFAEEQPVPLRVLADPELVTFRAIGARRGLKSSLHLGTLWSAWRALRSGFRQTGTQGDALQQGAVWIVAPGNDVIYRYTSAWAGDHPDPAALLETLRRRRPQIPCLRM